MSQQHDEDTRLLIRCPGCGQKFHVPDEILGKTVECGACEQRFKITSNEIVRGRKFYPGEKQPSSLNRFRRVPLPQHAAMAQAEDLPAGFAPIHYTEQPAPVAYEPPTAQRVIAGLIGGCLILLVLFLQLAGTRTGGMFERSTVLNQVLATSIICACGIALLVYANPKTRWKTLLLSTFPALLIVVLPIMFLKSKLPAPSGQSDATTTLSENSLLDPTAAKKSGAHDPFAAFREEFMTEPLEKEIRASADDPNRHAYGIWLSNLPSHDRYAVRDFLTRATDSAPTSYLYPRGENFLMVLSGCPLSFDQLVRSIAILGRIDKSSLHPEASLVEVIVNSDIFIEPPLDKLTDAASPAFYDLNLREMSSIDSERVKKAVQRLRDAEPKVYRIDITRRLIDLMNAPGMRFQDDICRALLVWAEDPRPAGDAALHFAKSVLERGEPMPPSVIDLMVKAKNPGVLSIIEQLWTSDVTAWENQAINLGTMAEPTFIAKLNHVKGEHLSSSVRILGKIGGATSLAALKELRPRTERELRVVIDASINSVQERLSR